MAKLTQDEKDAIRDAAIEQWWKDWFEEDYSWEGLAKKPWQGWVVVEGEKEYESYIEVHGLPDGCPNKACQVIPKDKINELAEGTETRNATLQDYWRDQENALQQHDNNSKRYTILHIPPHFENGEPSWKIDPGHKNWEKVSKVLDGRLHFGCYTDVQIVGKVEIVFGCDRRVQLNGCILAAVITQSFQISYLNERPSNPDPHEGMHTTFERTAFLTSQNLSHIRFGSTTNFGNALFLNGQVDFTGAQFSGGKANFKTTQFWVEKSIFYNSKFSGGEARFEDALFSGHRTGFRDVKFSGVIANFRNAQFSATYTSFENAQFLGEKTLFSRVQFSGCSLSFYKAKFSGGPLELSYAEFSSETTNFENMTSDFPVIFNEALFRHNCSFKNAIFDKNIDFINTQFPPSKGTQSAFFGTSFLGQVDFSRPTLTDNAGHPLPEECLHFPFNAFDHANIKDQLILTGRGDSYAQKEFDRALKSLDATCAKDETDKREERYVALERGCTTLKKAMEASSDKTRAQRFFKFEMLARAQRPSTGKLTKFVTWAYGVTADYGGSISRPLWGLLATWVVFTLIYGLNAFVIGITPSNSFSAMWGPMDLSATNIFRPFMVWSKAILPNDNTWLDLYQETLSSGGWLTIKLLATIQSFLSITFLFLFGLATKRKFQIG